MDGMGRVLTWYNLNLEPKPPGFLRDLTGGFGVLDEGFHEVFFCWKN